MHKKINTFEENILSPTSHQLYVAASRLESRAHTFLVTFIQSVAWKVNVTCTHKLSIHITWCIFTAFRTVYFS